MSLLQMSFYGAILIVAIIIIRAVALHRLPKKVFVILWCVALLRLLFPFSIPSGFSLYSLLPGSDALSDALTVPRTVLVTGNPSVNFLAPTVTPLPGDIDASAEINYYMAPDGSVYPEESVLYTPSHTYTPGISILISPYKELFVPFETFFWVIGLILFSVFFAVTYFRCYREFQTSLPVKDEKITAWLADYPLKRTIQVRQSDRISAPLTYGFFDPVILLPKNMDFENEKQLHYVLYHEYTHIRHFDSVTKLVMIFTLCIHWFNPFVWVMYVLFNRDMEFYCDECVLASEEGDSRSAYANTLIHMEETRSPFMPFCNHFSKSALEERITSIMKSKKVTLGALFLGAFIVLVVLLTLLTSAEGSSRGKNPAPTNLPTPTVTPTPSATPAPTMIPSAEPTVTPVPGPQYPDYFMPVIDKLHNNDISVEFTKPSSQLFVFREGSLEFTEPSQENAYTLTFSKLAYTETETLEDVSVDLSLYFSKYAWAPNTLHYREETRCIYISYALAPHKQPINGPSILLIEIPVDEPQAYTVIPFGYGNETDLYHSALWFTEAYLLDNFIYYNMFSHEGTLWAINLDTKQLFSLSHVNSALNSAALEHLRLYSMDETYSVCTAVCYKQGDVTVYSGNVSKEMDTPVLFTVYLAYDGDTLIDTLYLDTTHMAQ